MSTERHEIGKITHYYPKIAVAVVELTDPITVGETVLIRGTCTDFEQVFESMQIEHKDVKKAEAGQSIGLKVKDRVREKDIVYK
jgi:hypothetical protein